MLILIVSLWWLVMGATVAVNMVTTMLVLITAKDHFDDND